jgi:outer membrane protein assembly factor BamA
MLINSHKTLTYKILRNLIGFFCLCFLLVQQLAAQQKYYLQIPIKTKDFLATDSLERIYTDSFSIKIALQSWQNKAFAKNYFEASVDELKRKDTIFTAILHLGKPYQWIYVNKGNVDNYILDKVGFRQKRFDKKPLNFLELQSVQEKSISFLENHGYPFAKISLDSISINDYGVKGSLNLQKGEKMYFDGIQLEDDSVKIATQYLENYLGISPKTLYEQQKISSIKSRLRELPFLTMEGESYLTFTGNKAKVNVLLKKSKASRFDAVLGLLPSGAGADDKKLSLSGTLNLDLQNLLGKGERFFADFQRVRPETQELKLQLTYPYIFNYNIGVDASLNIYKADTSFTDIRLNLGLQYLFSGNNFIKLYWAQALTNLDRINKTDIVVNRRLPERLDVDVNAYGVEIDKQHLDYRFNPRKGWQVKAKSDIGNRVIRKSSRIIELTEKFPSFNFSTLYDSLTLRSLRLQANVAFDYFIPLFKQSTLKIGIQGAGLFTQTPIYQNEQYRIGGNRILRGFNEASIYATRYALATLEYRFLFGQNSYFNVFADAAYIENKTTRLNLIEKPLGLGAGMTFETRAGLFSIAYALGKPYKNSFDVKNGKIHFGYVNLF